MRLRGISMRRLSGHFSVGARDRESILIARPIVNLTAYALQYSKNYTFYMVKVSAQRIK